MWYDASSMSHPPLERGEEVSELNASEEYMRVGDVREYLKISRSMAYNLCDGRKFAVCQLGRVKLVRKSDLESYLRSCATYTGA
jgi:hypothetical protein